MDDRVTTLVRAMAREDHDARLGRLRVPTLLVLGPGDEVPRLSRAAHCAGVPGPTVAVLPRWNQTPMIEQPEVFTAVVRAWLGRIALARLTLSVG